MKIFLLAICLTGSAFAQAPAATTEKRELIYCPDRMTHEEREAYRARMQAARTYEEKEALRAAHRTDMQARVTREGAPGFCDTPLQQRLRQGQQGRRP
jgi:hypothetical protein